MSEILLSQLAYAELISPMPDEAVQWMKDVPGLGESGFATTGLFAEEG